MDLKKKLKRFFTLTRKANDGFTLVELIVVIAILAILAGVGSVGYAGYIKAANKGNDKVLVGEIMRAIEMGTYSTMFTSNDSFKMGDISYPVGFVALTTDGAQVVTSNTTKTEGAGGCEFETISGTIKTGHIYTSTCGRKTSTYYTVANGELSYCKTHSPAPIIESVGGRQYVSGYGHTCNTSIINWVCSASNTETYSTYSDGVQVISNQDALYQAASGGFCEYAYANQHGGFTGANQVGAATTGNALYDSLTAAFGDVNSLKLSYDGWSSDGNIDYATFYTSAPELMEDMERLTDLLVIGDGLADLANKDLGLSGDYENGEEVLTGVSSAISSTHTEDSWMEQWNGVATSGTWDSYGFGLEGRENYSAARMAYNNAFASYVDVADPSLSAYTETIREFYSQELFGVGLPGLVCTDAFTDSASPLKSKINNDEAFNKIAALYETYKNSPACTENGKLVYGTLNTFNDTADIASDSNNAYGGDMFDYYNSYVNEISALYNAAQDAAGDGIIIIVSVEDGLVKCDVSPAEANPRNA